ncbi:PREDICTED: uncharacterized protein LOC105567322 [Vollenhovia emeryi]|uniref:uncharacterized protein LOC105567322 n=1 Tax=Vollenhovia emeryi TaxID=411798 RepID=UPI0005F3BCF0|nr:PREDICTED: uncharacterized protein LOC105567322 [Vollenhovia emeryi]
MYESRSEIDESLSDALALLHSTEPDSAQRLRRMLDACIERKHGHEKTLAVRMPGRFLQSVDGSALPMATSRGQDRVARGRSVINAEIWDGDPEIISLLETDEPENVGDRQTSGIKVFEVDYEDCREDERDVPRISIPDEGFADGTVCKICSGCEPRPLISLECQEAYYPPSHQLPVIDVDVYEPTSCVQTVRR